MSSFRRNLECACCNSRPPDPVPVGPQKLPVCHLDAVPIQVSAIVGHGPDDGDEKKDPYGRYQDHRLLRDVYILVSVISSNRLTHLSILRVSTVSHLRDQTRARLVCVDPVPVQRYADAVPRRRVDATVFVD